MAKLGQTGANRAKWDQMGLNGAKWGKRGQIGPNGVKLLSIDDSYFLHNMAKVEKLMTDLRKEEVP